MAEGEWLESDAGTKRGHKSAAVPKSTEMATKGPTSPILSLSSLTLSCSPTLQGPALLDSHSTLMLTTLTSNQ